MTCLRHIQESILNQKKTQLCCSCNKPSNGKIHTSCVLYEQGEINDSKRKKMVGEEMDLVKIKEYLMVVHPEAFGRMKKK